MKYIDLHTHTTASDGSLTPTQVVELGISTGLSALAITDHDTTAGIDEALACRENIEVIPGIEISSLYDEVEIHIVGLFINHKSTDLATWLESLHYSREKRNRDMLDRLNALGLDLTREEVLASSGCGTITRAHFASALLKKGYVTSTNEAFAKYLGYGCKAYVPRTLPSCATAIKQIRAAGGISIMAHPLLYKVSSATLNKILTHLKEAGLTGIEAYYSTHKGGDTHYVKELAQAHGLLLSGGSDFHGENKKGLHLGSGYGSLKVPYDLLNKLKGELK